MAQTANSETVARASREPGWKTAIGFMRTDIKKKKERIQGVTAEIGEIWGKIVGLKVNKVGAKMFMLMDKLEQDERVDAMRSFNKLCENAGWPEQVKDLVDEAEGGGGVNMHGKGQSEAADDVEKALDAEIDKPAPPPKKTPKKVPVSEAIQGAKSHLRVVDRDQDLAH